MNLQSQLFFFNGANVREMWQRSLPLYSVRGRRFEFAGMAGARCSSCNELGKEEDGIWNVRPMEQRVGWREREAREMRKNWCALLVSKPRVHGILRQQQ